MDPQTSPQRSTQSRISERERKRAARACDSCRRQKEKCDGGVPCRRCVRLSRQCEFSGRASGLSGLRDAPHPRRDALRSVPAHKSESRATAKRVAYLERIAQKCAGDQTTVLSLDALRQLAGGGDDEMHSLHAADSSSASSGSEAVDDKFTVEPVQENIAHYSGEFSHWNFSMRIKKWIDQGVPNDSLNQPAGSITNFKEYYRAEELQSPSVMLASLSVLPPRPIGEFLVSCFFNHAQANYCYVDRDWLRGKLDLVYDNQASLSRRDVGVVCMVLSLLAIGTQYAYLEKLADGTQDLSGDLESGGGLNTSSEDSLGIMFYQQASRLLPDVITLSSVECVQACLLLGIYTLPIDASGLSYLYLGLAIKLAILNGMHRKYSGTDLDAAACEARNRVWWTVYTIEKRIGTLHGRPLSISHLDVDAALPTDEPGTWASSTQPAHMAQVLATLQLNQQLDKMSREISVLRTSPKSEMTDGLARLVDLQRDLERWWNNLPDDVACKETTSLTKISRGSWHLKLEYCLVRMFVGRVFILPQLRQGDGTASNQESPGESSTTTTTTTSPSSSSLSRKRLRTILVANCVKAAMLVIETCRAIRNSVGLARASYTEFSSCRAALLVITTQCLQNKTYQFRQSLRDGLSMLKEMSSSSESAHSETSLIQAFERAIANFYSAGTQHRPDQSDTESEYKKFQRWQQSLKSEGQASAASGPGDGTVASQQDGVSANDKNMMAPPPPATGVSRSSSDDPAHDMMYAASCTPFFGVDGNFASFPQNPEDLSAFFGADFGSGEFGAG